MLSVASTRTEPKSSAIITAPGEKCGLARALVGALEVSLRENFCAKTSGTSVDFDFSEERNRSQSRFHASLGWPSVVIGGTPNIRPNIITERILGLPKH